MEDLEFARQPRFHSEFAKLLFCFIMYIRLKFLIYKFVSIHRETTFAIISPNELSLADLIGRRAEDVLRYTLRLAMFHEHLSIYPQIS